MALRVLSPPLPDSHSVTGLWRHDRSQLPRPLTRALLVLWAEPAASSGTLCISLPGQVLPTRPQDPVSACPRPPPEGRGPVSLARWRIPSAQQGVCGQPRHMLKSNLDFSMVFSLYWEDLLGL